MESESINDHIGIVGKFRLYRSEMGIFFRLFLSFICNAIHFVFLSTIPLILTQSYSLIVVTIVIIIVFKRAHFEFAIIKMFWATSKLSLDYNSIVYPVISDEMTFFPLFSSLPLSSFLSSLLVRASLRIFSYPEH